MELELNTFGAMLAYAMHLESESAAFYEKAGERAASPALATLFQTLAADALRRRETLERVRQENVTEMILTPIHDFHARDYAPAFSVPQGDEPLRDAARVIEETRERYYLAATGKTELAEAARALARLGRGNQEHRQRLAALAIAEVPEETHGQTRGRT